MGDAAGAGAGSGPSGVTTLEAIATTVSETSIPRESADAVEIIGKSVKGTKNPGENGDAKDSILELERTKKDESTMQKVPILKLFGFADKIDITLIIVGTIAAAVAGAPQPVMTIFYGDLINAFGQNAGDPDRLVHAVRSVVLRIVYIGIAAGVAGYLEVACWTIAGERQASRIRGQYLKAILRQDVSFFDSNTSTGEVITRMSGDTVLIQNALGEKAGLLIQLLSTFIGGYLVAFIKSWKLTLVLMAVMPLFVIIGGIVAIFISRTTSREQLAYAGAGTLVEQIVGAIRTVASNTGEQKAVQDYDKNLRAVENAGIWQGLVAGVGFGIVIGTMLATFSLALWYGSKLVLNEGLTGGQVINVLFAVLTGAMAMSQASPSWSAIAAGQGAAYKIFDVIKRNPIIDIYDTSGLVPGKVKGDVELRNVDFRYPTRPDVLVLSKFSLIIPAGKTVALVGESGSGKSTVTSLIERFYDPESGAVLVDGMDIRTIQLKWLRQQIGLVSQEPALFNTSIKENIAYGKENATPEEIEDAAVLANVAKFITKIPQGYQTLVGERGIQLSGGQKQRVAIARAILKNPRILLLDEATSALDAESERVVQDALDRIMTDRTTLVIAHRLTTIRNADMIAVVQRGVIVEAGKVHRSTLGVVQFKTVGSVLLSECSKCPELGRRIVVTYIALVAGPHDELIRDPDGAYSQLVRLQRFYGKKEIVADTPKDPDYVLEVDDSAILTRSSEIHSSRSGSFRNSGAGGSKRMTRIDIEVGTNTGIRKAADDVSLFRLAKLSRPEAPMFVIGACAAAAGGVVFPILGSLLSSVISSFFEPPHKLRKDINFWALMFLVIAVGDAIAIAIRYYTFAIIGQRLIRRVRRMTFEKVLCQEISWFDEQNSSGAISARLSADGAAVRGAVGDAFSLLVSNLATITGGIIIAFVASWQLALLLLVLVPLLGTQNYAHMRWTKGFSEDAKVKYENATRVANDGVGSIRTVASFVAEERICNLYNEKCREPVRNGIRQGLLAGAALGFANFVTFCTMALCFWVGSKLIANGSSSFQDVFRVFFAITLSSLGVTIAAALSPDFAKVKLAVNSIFSVLDRKSKIDPSDMSGNTLKVVKGEIEFKHVSFFYPTRPDTQIFHDLSFKVQAGQTLALVGESGSGKSTVVSLIERFYEPQSGGIFMDGVDIQRLQLKWLRQQIGLVSQEPVLFDENVDWNIVYGQEGKVNESEIQAAAEAANAHRFISALPEGYKTRVGERGTQLSGGQKQRVAIGRAILKDPKILLLDEATSALDAESEHVVQEALNRVMVDRTTIVVAHRLSTVRNADIIAVLKDGAIVEHGKHEELIAKDGAYAALVKLHIS